VSVRPSGVCLIENNRPHRGNAFNSQLSRVVTSMTSVDRRNGTLPSVGPLQMRRSGSLCRQGGGSITQRVCLRIVGGVDLRNGPVSQHCGGHQDRLV